MNITYPTGIEGTDIRLTLTNCNTGQTENPPHIGHFLLENNEGDAILGTVSLTEEYKVDIIQTMYNKGRKDAEAVQTTKDDETVQKYQITPEMAAKIQAIISGKTDTEETYYGKGTYL